MAESDAHDPAGQGQADSDGTVENAVARAQASLDQVTDEVEESSGPNLDRVETAPADANRIELLSDVDLNVMIELGRTEMLVEDVLQLQSGSVVELDKLAGDPVDVIVNGQLVARGEVLVLNDTFCIRISEIVANLEEQVGAAAKTELTQTMDL